MSTIKLTSLDLFILIYIFKLLNIIFIKPAVITHCTVTCSLLQVALLHLSVSTYGVIGQFCRPYFIVWPAKFPLTLTSFLSRTPD